MWCRRAASELGAGHFESVGPEWESPQSVCWSCVGNPQYSAWHLVNPQQQAWVSITIAHAVTAVTLHWCFLFHLTLLPLLNSSTMNYLLFLYCIIYIFTFYIGWCFGILETFWLGSYWPSLGRKGLILEHVFDIRTNQSRARPILSRLCFPGSKILLPYSPQGQIPGNQRPPLYLKATSIIQTSQS